MNTVEAMNGKPCPCGRPHRFEGKVLAGRGTIDRLGECLAQLGAKRPFLLADPNTYAAAGQPVEQALKAAGLTWGGYTFPKGDVEPDEASVGAAVMHFDGSCDAILGIGSGVINDIGKILSHLTGKPYVIVATAPSMDGYASASSSMNRDGLKISLPTRSADVIIGDTRVLCNAPLHMMKAGLGDMLAKYVSICEWRISALLTGEYYCPQVAELIRGAVRRCVDNAQGLLRREEQAVLAVFQGLVIGGIAMNFAGLSRPASGVEHYISHVLDMRALEFGTPAQLHGIQCAVGTLIAARLYEKLVAIQPQRQKALAYAQSFHYAAWAAQLRALLGKGAESMIALEPREGKYDLQAHAQRLERILENWPKILEIISQELPGSAAIEALLDTIQAPKSLAQMGMEEKELPLIFYATKDIRDKYVLSRLAWDLGVLEELL